MSAEQWLWKEFKIKKSYNICTLVLFLSSLKTLIYVLCIYRQRKSACSCLTQKKFLIQGTEKKPHFFKGNNNYGWRNTRGLVKMNNFTLQHRCILLALNLNGLFQGDGSYSVKRCGDSERWREPYNTRPTVKLYTNILWRNWENLGQNLFEAADYRYETQTKLSKVLVLNTANDIKS